MKLNELENLEKELYSLDKIYNDKVNKKFNAKTFFTKILDYLKRYVENSIIYFVRLAYEAVKDRIKKLYNLSEEHFENLKIKLVNYLYSPFPNTIAFGAYESKRDLYGNLIEGIIYIPYWLVFYPKKFIETMAHELVHYVQDLKGKLRDYRVNSFEDYLNSLHEKEAKRIASMISKDMFNHPTLRIFYYGNSRMYLL